MTSENSTTDADAQSKDDSEQCHRCEERPADVNPDSSDPPLCQQCVQEIMRESSKEADYGV